MENHGDQPPSSAWQNLLHQPNSEANPMEKPESLGNLNNSESTSSDEIMEDSPSARPNNPWQQMGYAEKEAAIQQELKKINHLPRNSSYVVHRLRVLHTILHLLATERTASQEKELELLFSGLSL